MFFKLAMVGLTTIAWAALDTEPQCYSRFDYEYKVLKKLIELENAQKKQQETTEDLLQDFENMKITCREKTAALEKTNFALKSLNKSINGLSLEKEGAPRESRPRKDRVVAFSACLSKTLSNINDGQTILFDDVILNEGGGYDASSGVFTCPRTGVYLITFTLGVRGELQVFGTLMVDDEESISVQVQGRHSGQELTGSNSVAVKLYVNGRVWVKHISGSALESYPGLKTSSFSAVLLSPDA